MEKKYKFLTMIVMFALVIEIALASIFMFNNNASITQLVEPINVAEVNLLDKTGNTAAFSSAGSKYKLGGMWTYKKDGVRNLNVYCAQKGTSSPTGKAYPRSEGQWNENAGVWKDEESYQKITWIKMNFWENENSTAKYTNNEKLAILKKADSSITLQDVTNVYDNTSEVFKLYQLITWKYTNGKQVSVDKYNVSDSTKKIYNAIIKLADENYTITNPELTVSSTEGAVWNDDSKTYTWNVKINNTFVLPYEKSNDGNSSFVVEVDETQIPNITNQNTGVYYSYDGEVLTVYGLTDDVTHNFKISASTHRIESTGSVWWSDKYQNYIEITGSIKNPKSVLATTHTSPTVVDGKFNLNILKIDEENNEIENVTFNVTGDRINTTSPFNTDADGIAKILEGEEITQNDSEFEYTISEVNTDVHFLKLTQDFKVVLVTGTRNANNSICYSIEDAYFEINNGNSTITGLKEITVKAENGKQVTVKLDLVKNGDSTTIIVTVPNIEKVYDLALTKTIVTSVNSLLDEYDIDRNGEIDTVDSIIFFQLQKLFEGTESYSTIKDFMQGESNGLTEVYDSYYKYFTEQELQTMLIGFEVNSGNKADACAVLEEKANDVLVAYVKASIIEADIDRLLTVVTQNRLNYNEKTTADYILNKIPYEIEVTDEIIYKITVYNEGDYDSKNITITDYLPEGLVVCDVDVDGIANYNGYNWVVDENKNTAKITINTEELLKAYDGKQLQRTNVYIKCKIDDELITADGKLKENNGVLNYQDILYNVAEITSSEPVDSEGNVVQDVVDRDSEENSIATDTNNSIVSNYSMKFETIENVEEILGNDSSSLEKSNYDYEDDDDFERVVIKENLSGLDLSLRKSITKTGTSEETMIDIISEHNYADENEKGNRLPAIIKESAEQCISTGTGLYFHDKEAVEVESGDFVEYTLRVYNEGSEVDYAGYAKQITDYLPEGLEFHAVVDNTGKWITTTENGVYKTTVDDYYGGYEVSYDKENNKVVIDYVGNLGLKTRKNLEDIVKLYNIDSEFFGYYNSKEDNIEKYAYQEIKLICKVVTKENSKLLTNIAEITDSVAVTATGEIIENVTDRDSSANITISTETDIAENKVNLDTYYADKEVDDEYNSNYPGCEDDDDFETVVVKVLKGEYSLQIKKINSLDNKPIDGVSFVVNNTKTNPTENGITLVSKQEFYKEDLNVVDKFIISEIATGENQMYLTINEPVTVYIRKGLINGKYDVSSVSFEKESIVTEKMVTLEDSSEVKVTVTLKDNVIEVTIPNKPTYFDLSLRKFISSINGKLLEGESSREPVVDTEKLLSGEETTAEYEHTKDVILVNPSDIVEYTIRVYNEGGVDGYANRIMDDIPEGVEMVAPTYDENGNPTNINAEYGWVMYKEYDADADNSETDGNTSTEGNANQNEETSIDTIIMYNEKMYIKTDKAEEAVLIVTSHLSKEAGELNASQDGKNPNLLEKLDVSTGVLKYKDVKVEFKVKTTNQADKVITNYAQITEETDENGSYVKDRDSTPNVWNEGEDDQDIENIKVTHFDLNLYKWVTKAIVTEDGKTTEYDSKHTELDKSNLVNVVIPKDKLNKTIVKFEYQIKVGNEGLIPGYATEIKDHIPAGLKFIAEDNKDYGWVLEEDGTITTDYLKDTLLKPGETAEVTVVLTWINGEDNLGEKDNFAEISEDYNEYSDTPDIDSTPDNFTNKVVEDDEDHDIVMLQVRTGDIVMIQYISIAIAVAVIIGLGVAGIKKFVI